MRIARNSSTAGGSCQVARFVALSLLPVATSVGSVLIAAALIRLDVTALSPALSLECWLTAYAVFGGQSVLWALILSTLQPRSLGCRCTVGAVLGGLFGGTPALAGADPMFWIALGVIAGTVAVLTVDWAIPVRRRGDAR